MLCSHADGLAFGCLRRFSSRQIFNCWPNTHGFLVTTSPHSGGRSMRISEIAARLRKVASDLDAAAEKRDYDFPDDTVLPLIQNAFVDDNVVRSFVVDLSSSPR
jgi:hypothetical protein